MVNLIYASNLDLGTKKADTCFEILVTSNCSSVSLSEVTNKNTTYIINQAMTKLAGQTFNYSFCNSSILGGYTFSFNPSCKECTDVNCIGNFKVTTTGYELGIPTTIVFLMIIGIIILLIVLLFIFGMKSELFILKLFCLGLSVLLIIFCVGYIMSIANITIGEFSDLTGVFTNLYLMFTIILSVAGIGLILYLIYYAFDAFYKHRGLK